MAESTTTSTPSARVAGIALARRVLFLVLLGPATLGLGSKVQGGGGPSAASFISTSLVGGPARNLGLLYLAVAALALLAAVAVVPAKK
jgi:hypothetical protein